MVRCAVWLLARFDVAVDGQAVPADAWRGRRAADLVKILALEPSHALHREQVMELLWPELGPDAAGANLRKAIHHARRAMGSDDAVQGSSGMLSLWGGEVTVDAARFTAAAAAAVAAGDAQQCKLAADLYHGDALPADRYEPWAAQPRARLRAQYLAVLKGARQFERVIELDPTDEESHRELLRGHFESGRRREAIRQFECLRDALREFVGVGPDRETIALYEQVLAADGAPVTGSAHRAAALIATGLVHLNRNELAAAEQLARQARDLAIGAELAHELGDASTLLALVASFTGRWHEIFRQEFTESLRLSPENSVATYDANLCFAEYHLAGAAPAPDAHAYAGELLELATSAGSVPGRGMAELMVGEALMSSGQFSLARDQLRRAADTNTAARATSSRCVSLERLAQTELALADSDRADALLASAFPLARAAPLRSHLVVRLLGVDVQAARHTPRALAAVGMAERELADATRVCEPCSLNFRVQASITCAGAGEPVRARRHLADAERISGLWQGGPSAAAVWEARAALRRAEGQPAQAAALLREAADEYAKARRAADEARCRSAAARL
ncbi:BTAD domain-containing putative transcriptional regulator [Catellatospora sichuanensis]|uniref:BTAD domain-containing putative transcriptional regulator n=1 Tax=Catellatospora sichuanensis TaxID=1969805 RepID=UPI001181E2B8|nr:BTAD domain-containing putative transcriptional regulator [Catellatospora sichuanensis]